MNRFANFLFVLACFSLAWAQSSQSQITISTQPPSAQFFVDGKLYTGAATFLWPTGSKHILQFKTDPIVVGQSGTSVTQTTPDGGIQYGFTGWSDTAGLIQPANDPVQTVTADPSITAITAQLVVGYRVTLNYFNSGGLQVPPTCGSPGNIPPGVFRPGIVVINNTCYWTSTSFYVPSGTLVLNAIPYPGFVFVGWQVDLGPTNAYLRSIPVNAPVQLAPQFSPAKRVEFFTNPLGLEVLIDRTPTPTRTLSSPAPGVCPSGESLPPAPPSGISPLCFGDFDFLPGSSHLIGGVTPQRDIRGKWWVFGSWSNGGGQNAVFKADTNLGTPDRLTANFVAGAPISFLTSPPGLKLSIDGNQNWPGYNFVWGVGETHTAAPVMQQFDKRGRKYVYQNWSNNASATQTVTVDQNAANSGLRLIANFQLLNRLVVQTKPSGLTVSVDGKSCQTPCNLDRANGAQVEVAAPSSIGMGNSARMNFHGWSDGGKADHMVTINADTETVSANYTSSYQLSSASNIAGGVTFSFAPKSSDGYYPANSQVTVTAHPNPGFKFLRWDGDLNGTYPMGTLSMGTARSVTAILGRVPFVGPAGVQNAAGPTPSGTIAPGSIFSILGQSLARQALAGPVNPLTQSLEGVTVTVGERILGLLYVSPEQINAQLPSDLPNGNHTLLVHSESQPDVSATFTVARNSPGLFQNVVNAQPYVVGLHEDGSTITPSSPAKMGEVISVLGTGFGPYSKTVPDGFATQAPAPPLLDALVISAGDTHPEAVWSGAEAGSTGVAVTKFRITPDLPSGASVELKVQVNGQTSNTVLLPIK